MSAFSLTYVSRARLPAATAEPVVWQIVAKSVEYNAAAGITGALLYSGTNFVQILEGEPAPVLELMEAIRNDPRHDQVDVLQTKVGVERRFAGWSMAYLGRSLFVQARVQDILRARERDEGLADAVREMHDLMYQFVRAA